MKKILYILLIMILIIVGYYIYSDLSYVPAESVEYEIGNDLVFEKDGVLYEFEEVESEDFIDIKAPKLDNIPKEAEEMARNIEKSPNSFVLWNDLASIYQSVGNYEKAEEIWQYLAQKWPKNWLSFLNLANLQAYYLRSPEEAEKNYLKSIEINPGNVAVYIRIHEFYRDLLKNKAKSVEIIKKGIENNPNEQLLKDFLKEIQ